MKTTFDLLAVLVVATFLGAILIAVAERFQDRPVERAMEECGYIPHPISDVAWELYARGKVPVGTAWYYTGAVRSANLEAADCMRKRFEPEWGTR